MLWCVTMHNSTPTIHGGEMDGGCTIAAGALHSNLFSESVAEHLYGREVAVDHRNLKRVNLLRRVPCEHHLVARLERLDVARSRSLKGIVVRLYRRQGCGGGGGSGGRRGHGCVIVGVLGSLQH